MAQDAVFHPRVAEVMPMALLQQCVFQTDSVSHPGLMGHRLIAEYIAHQLHQLWAMGGDVGASAAAAPLAMPERMVRFPIAGGRFDGNPVAYLSWPALGVAPRWSLVASAAIGQRGSGAGRRAA